MQTVERLINIVMLGPALVPALHHPSLYAQVGAITDEDAKLATGRPDFVVTALETRFRTRH